MSICAIAQTSSEAKQSRPSEAVEPAQGGVEVEALQQQVSASSQSWPHPPHQVAPLPQQRISREDRGGAILDEADAEQTATEARASAKEVATVRAAMKVRESELAQTQRDSASVN